MKISLKLIIWPMSELAFVVWCFAGAHILVSEMLEKLQFAVCALREDWSAEGLHDLLDSHGLASELVLGRAAPRLVYDADAGAGTVWVWTYQTRPKAPMPTGCRSVYLYKISSAHC
jgi:hypothetical protein